MCECVPVCVSFLRSCLPVCVWAVVYKLKCLNICISFCLRLACSHTHILPSHTQGGVVARRHTAKFLWLRHWFSGEGAAGKTRREGEGGGDGG